MSKQNQITIDVIIDCVDDYFNGKLTYEELTEELTGLIGGQDETERLQS